MALPRLILTGSSGFVGRNLLDEIKETWRVFGVARRSQLRCGAPFHPNIAWFHADIGEREALRRVFDEIYLSGGANLLVHLAAHYDFTGVEDPEYRRTNVDGLRNVLELSRGLGLSRFVFSSSIAACKAPPPGGVLDESSPPDGEHIYARTKAAGERMLAEYRAAFPSTIVRFAAMYSDWCEYPPLYFQLGTWRSKAWNRRILGGRGESAIPYLHVHDGAALLRRVIERTGPAPADEILVASPDGCVSHRQLFERATAYGEAAALRPILMPRALSRAGLWMRLLAGRLAGHEPFERPWMARYIDRQFRADSRRTRERLGWEPRARLAILDRLPILLENQCGDALEWTRRNEAAFKEISPQPNLEIAALLEKHATVIAERFTVLLSSGDDARRFPTYRRVSDESHEWHHRLILIHLMQSVRTRDRGIFLDYCRDLAAHRRAQGFPAVEVIAALELLNRLCIEMLTVDPASRGVRRHLHGRLTATIAFGCDAIEEVYETAAADEPDREAV